MTEISMALAAPSHERLYGSDMEHLKQKALDSLLFVVAVLAWVAFIDAVRAGQRSPWMGLCCAYLTLGSIVAGARRHREPREARAVLAACLVGGYFCLVLTYPDSSVRYFGALALLTTSCLFTGADYRILTALMIAGLGALELAVPAAAVGPTELARCGLMLLGSASLSVLARNHLTTALMWSSQSTLRSLTLAETLRDRQMLLNRTLRAMEEATYRIERMNNELILAQREAEIGRIAKSRFAATVSHEIRGPLNLILGFSRMLALCPERYSDDLTPDYHTDVDVIYRNAQHLCALVDDVLDMSRIEVERLPLIKEPIDLHGDVVAPTLASVRPLAESRKLHLHDEFTADLPTIVADPVRVRQALLNLLLNAIRLTERGGVTVQTRREEEHLLISVADTGPGIAPAQLANIFREFSQLHAQRRPSDGGSGLGLSITKGLVEAHGGRIWVESRLDVGTVITFALPLTPAAAGPEALVRLPDSGRRATGHTTCLVVHDDPGVVHLLSRHIEGFHVVGLTKPDHAADLVDELRPRAVIANADFAAAVADDLAALPFDVPLITCSLPRTREIASLSHVPGYVTKPVLPEDLLAFVTQVKKEGGLTVLVVDDEPDAARLLESILASCRRVVATRKAYDGLQALEVMRATPPDLVLMDWFMPRLGGEETLARMRADPRLERVPVVIVSGRDSMEGLPGIGMPISVSCARPLEIGRGARCLRVLLETLTPDYLPETTTPRRCAAVPPG